MPRLTLLLLLLCPLTTFTLSGGGILPFAAVLISPDSGQGEDPSAPIFPEPSPASGWEFDPNG